MKTANLFLLAAVLPLLLAAAGCAPIKSAAALPIANESVQTNAGGANKSGANNKATANKATTDGATVQKATADALVKELYRRHDEGASPFLQTKDRRLVDKYFVKPLADLIWQDAQRVINDETDVDPDPLYDGGQDSDIKKFAIGQPSITGDQATVVASYLDFGKKRTITFRLVQENQNWKIADIKYSDGSSLLRFYRAKAGN